jgi:MFS family permease
MNVKRVVLGGLLAGLVINIGETLLNTVVLGEQMNAQFARLNLPPMTGGVIGIFVALCFLLGIVLTWVYAAIRPRYGAGPKTAMMAAAAVWFCAYLFPGIGQIAMGVFTPQLMGLSLLWGFFEVMLAGVAGAYLYQETHSRRTTAVV